MMFEPGVLPGQTALVGAGRFDRPLAYKQEAA